MQAETHKQGKILREWLDGASRSRMFMMLLSMRRAGMITRDDLAGFSPKLRDEVFFDFPPSGAADEGGRRIAGDAGHPPRVGRALFGDPSLDCVWQINQTIALVPAHAAPVFLPDAA